MPPPLASRRQKRRHLTTWNFSKGLPPGVVLGSLSLDPFRPLGIPHASWLLRMTRRHFIAAGADSSRRQVRRLSIPISISTTRPGRRVCLGLPRAIPCSISDRRYPAGICSHGPAARRDARAIVVEASAWLEDNQWVLDLGAKSNPIIAGLVGHLSPGTPEFRQHLARFVSGKNPLFPRNPV